MTGPQSAREAEQLQHLCASPPETHALGAKSPSRKRRVAAVVNRGDVTEGLTLEPTTPRVWRTSDSNPTSAELSPDLRVGAIDYSFLLQESLL
jgi:hypothetical protein